MSLRSGWINPLLGVHIRAPTRSLPVLRGSFGHISRDCAIAAKLADRLYIDVALLPQISEELPRIAWRTFGDEVVMHAMLTVQPLHNIDIVKRKSLRLAVRAELTEVCRLILPRRVESGR